jgi:hypothetical protein
MPWCVPLHVTLLIFSGQNLRSPSGRITGWIGLVSRGLRTEGSCRGRADFGRLRMRSGGVFDRVGCPARYFGGLSDDALSPAAVAAEVPAHRRTGRSAAGRELGPDKGAGLVELRAAGGRSGAVLDRRSGLCRRVPKAGVTGSSAEATSSTGPVGSVASSATGDAAVSEARVKT